MSEEGEIIEHTTEEDQIRQHLVPPLQQGEMDGEDGLWEIDRITGFEVVLGPDPNSTSGKHIATAWFMVEYTNQQDANFEHWLAATSFHPTLTEASTLWTSFVETRSPREWQMELLNPFGNPADLLVQARKYRRLHPKTPLVSAPMRQVKNSGLSARAPMVLGDFRSLRIAKSEHLQISLQTIRAKRGSPWKSSSRASASSSTDRAMR
jgi:hypothetical protein